MIDIERLTNGFWKVISSESYADIKGPVKEVVIESEDGMQVAVNGMFLTEVYIDDAMESLDRIYLTWKARQHGNCN